MKPGKKEIVAITGAAAGVGRAIVNEFADHGAHIGLIARNKERLETAKQYVERRGGKAICLPCNTSNFDQVDAAAERIEQELGPIDVWVNCPMVTIFAPFSDICAAIVRRRSYV